MKISILTVSPKVSVRQVEESVKEAGFECVTKNADAAVVIGGDGVFSYFGRAKSVPLLFVGIRSKTATGSKAYLAEVTLDRLETALNKIKRSRYRVEKYKRLAVLLNDKKLGEVFTDVSLERGAESNCLRYELVTTWKGNRSTDFAIANGVVVCTRAGSTGYFSYLDKLRFVDRFEPDKSSVIGVDEIGVCHIAPAYTERENSSVHPLRYTIPWESRVSVRLKRDADARLYGISKSRNGIGVRMGDVVTIAPGRSTTQIIKLTN